MKDCLYKREWLETLLLDLTTAKNLDCVSGEFKLLFGWSKKSRIWPLLAEVKHQYSRKFKKQKVKVVKRLQGCKRDKEMVRQCITTADHIQSSGLEIVFTHESECVKRNSHKSFYLLIICVLYPTFLMTFCANVLSSAILFKISVWFLFSLFNFFWIPSQPWTPKSLVFFPPLQPQSVSIFNYIGKLFKDLKDYIIPTVTLQVVHCGPQRNQKNHCFKLR